MIDALEDRVATGGAEDWDRDWHTRALMKGRQANRSPGKDSKVADEEAERERWRN